MVRRGAAGRREENETACVNALSAPWRAPASCSDDVKKKNEAPAATRIGDSSDK